MHLHYIISKGKYNFANVNNRKAVRMLRWKVIHECDTEDDKPTCWACEINHPEYGNFAWITETDNGYNVEIDKDEFVVLITRKSLTSAKRWARR